MNINFELYKVFYHVGKYLNFSQAANHLYISQSAVSQQIRLLEKSLGCRLFNRSTKQVSLTPEGHALYQYIKQAFRLIKEGEDSISAFQDLDRGEIRVGASDTICKYYLLPYFKKFHVLYPNIKIKIINRTSPACIELLQKDIVDLAVINIPPQQLPTTLKVQEIATIQDVFLVGDKYSYLCQKPISITKLQNYPFLLLEQHSVSRKYFDLLCMQYDIVVTPEIELGNLDLLIELTKIGLGISFAVREFISEELIAGNIYEIPIKEKIAERKIGLLAPTKTFPSKATSKFIELLIAQ